MTGHQRLWLVVNGGSGSHADDRIALLTDRLRPARVIDCQRETLPNCAALDDAGVSVLAVHGGDGTLNAAISGVEGWGGTVLPLPGGTANLLCHRLFGELTIESILDAFATGELLPSRPNCVHTSAGPAFAEVLAGPGAVWADVREALRDGSVSETIADAIDAASRSTTGPMIAIDRPALGNPEGYSGVRLVPGGAGMTVEGYGALQFTDYLKQALALLKRDFREGPHDELGTHRSLVCRSLGDEPIELMIDGERHTGSATEEFSLAPLGVDLFCMRDD